MQIKYIAQTEEDQVLIKQIIDEVKRYEQSGESHTLPISCIYSGRNQLYKVITERGAWVVKCFRRPNFFQGFYYSYLGKTKAERSHEYSIELDRRGVSVANTLGYALEIGALGFLGRSYHICRSLDAWEPHIHFQARGWAIPEGFMPALAKFLVQVHQSGVEHLDLSPGNILYTRSDDGVYRFALVDLNRMKLHSEPLSLSQSLLNMRCLISRSAPNRQLAYYYAVERGVEPTAVIEGLEREVSTFWIKRLYKLSYRYARKKYSTSLFEFTAILIKYKWALRSGNKRLAFELYQRYLQVEDIRHEERHRRGFSYRYEGIE